MERDGTPVGRTRVWRAVAWLAMPLGALALGGLSMAPGPVLGAATEPAPGDVTGRVPPAELLSPVRTVTTIKAFVAVHGLDRHDPSNVIREDGRYWVFYTRNEGDHQDVTVQLGSSEDGRVWIDHGKVLGRGPAGAWDESGTIAPYCVRHDGRLYLFYTGFRGGDLATRELGVAVAGHPAGPWERWGASPVLRRAAGAEAWDSGMLGDANVVPHGGRWWLYYKGRRAGETSRQTRVGVATADAITGPYERHGANPLFAGHAFTVWRHRSGWGALCGEVSPRVMWSLDGIRFSEAGMMPSPSAGLYTPGPEQDPAFEHGFDWGIEAYAEGGARGLRRFDLEPAGRRP